MQILNQRQKLLVIAPHPDDEVLGAGGLIQKVKQAGGQVFVLYLTVGDTQDFSQKGNSTITERQREIRSVVTALGIDAYDTGHIGSSHLRHDVLGRLEVMSLIERKSKVALEKIKPDIVAFPSLYSYNQDHQLAARATHAALRPAENGIKHFVKTVLAYEVPADSWSMHHQIVPNFFVPLTSKELKLKQQAMRLYASQMRPWPNPRSLAAIAALARLRGAHCVSDYAESYVGYRYVL